MTPQTENELLRIQANALPQLAKLSVGISVISSILAVFACAYVWYLDNVPVEIWAVSSRGHVAQLQKLDAKEALSVKARRSK